MARDRRRIVYNDDATLITEDNTSKHDEESFDRVYTKNVELGLDDVIGTYASYAQFKFDKGGESDGTCAVCGDHTAYPVRKLCVKCMKKYSEQLFDVAVQEGASRNKISLNITD